MGLICWIQVLSVSSFFPWGSSISKSLFWGPGGVSEVLPSVLLLLQVRQVRLFQDEEIYSDLYLTVCEWPSDSSKVIVFGFKYVSFNETCFWDWVRYLPVELPTFPWESGTHYTCLRHYGLLLIVFCLLRDAKNQEMYWCLYKLFNWRGPLLWFIESSKRVVSVPEFVKTLLRFLNQGSLTSMLF